MIRSSLTVALILIAAHSQNALAQSIEGNWKLTYVTAGTFEQTPAIVQLDVRDSKATGKLVAADPRLKEFSLKSVTHEGNALRVILHNDTVDMTFDVPLPVGAAKRMRGMMTASTGPTYPAWLDATELTELDQKSTLRLVDCPPMQEARLLNQKAAGLRFKARKAKDEETKMALMKQADDADATARDKTPKLHRDVLAKHADSPAVFEATLILCRSAQAQEYTVDDVKTWTTRAARTAEQYGPAWHAEFVTRLGSALATQEGFAPLAIDHARRAQAMLSSKATAYDEWRVLILLARALRKNGQADDAKALEPRMAKLDLALDREYLAKMPPFKSTPFAGRKSKSDRAVFFELFTGAMCPPCVAADLAFDVLSKTYQPSELVLIQYHLHIPGPDPLTNPDNEARWKYYTEAFEDDVRGVPSSLFNGKPQASGGGPFAKAQEKYEKYRDVIDPLLEGPSGVKLSAQARKKGNRIDIDVEVSGLVDPSPDKKLRILVTEQTIRYLGSNKVRFHHHVVRAFPGGVAGQVLKDKTSKHTASLDLTELRGQLTKYLDEYEANVNPFANPTRPLDFDNLRVVAFVQDDATHEILQVVQAEVAGDVNRR